MTPTLWVLVACWLASVVWVAVVCLRERAEERAAEAEWLAAEEAERTIDALLLARDALDGDADPLAQLAYARVLADIRRAVRGRLPCVQVEVCDN